MRLPKALSAILFTVFCSIPAANAAIYGDDNRTDIYASSTKIQQLARSSVALIKSYRFYIEKGLHHFIQTKLSYSSLYDLDTDTRFSNQPSRAFCSGVLIAPRAVLTARHCLEDEILERVAFVFDYQMKNATQFAESYTPRQVYSGVKVVFDDSALDGMAVVTLDRDVVGRTPVVYNVNAWSTYINTPIYTLHYPSGLPAKYSDDAYLTSDFYNRQDGYPGFRHNLDTFGGSSGAPIFNAETDQLIGVLMMGSKDYKTQRGTAEKYEARYGMRNIFAREKAAFINDTLIDLLAK